MLSVISPSYPQVRMLSVMSPLYPHLNSKLEISGAGRLLVSAPERRGRLVGVNLASIDLAGRGRDLRCADRRAEVGSPAMVRDARERTPPLGCFNTLENRFNTSGSVPQPPCKAHFVRTIRQVYTCRRIIIKETAIAAPPFTRTKLHARMMVVWLQMAMHNGPCTYALR